LRAALSGSSGIPEKKLSDNLILGTWNIREFGNTKYHGRMVESLYYIAEIISRFDLIAIQEVRDNLKDINSVCKILGNDWGIFTSLVTQGRSGNKERLCFLYDKRTVSFRNIAGQVILPQSDAGDKQFARAPYLIRFQAGWLKFDICTAHIYYGKAAKTSPEYKRRITEIKDLVKYMKTSYVDKEAISNVFLVGDFNIENVESDAYKAATSSIFKIPEKILKSNLRGTNVKGDKIYDQILYYNRFNDITFKNAGTFDFYQTVFNSYEAYETRIKKHDGNATGDKFDDFKTYQMSDHLPLWVEMNTDHTVQYLEYLKNQYIQE
jgi:exonuclease III